MYYICMCINSYALTTNVKYKCVMRLYVCEKLCIYYFYQVLNYVLQNYFQYKNFKMHIFAYLKQLKMN